MAAAPLTPRALVEKLTKDSGELTAETACNLLRKILAAALGDEAKRRRLRWAAKAVQTVLVPTPHAVPILYACGFRREFVAPLADAAPAVAKFAHAPQLESLLAMGFPEAGAKFALTQQGGDVDASINWCVSHRDAPEMTAPAPLPPPPPPPSSTVEVLILGEGEVEARRAEIQDCIAALSDIPARLKAERGAAKVARLKKIQTEQTASKAARKITRAQWEEDEGDRREKREAMGTAKTRTSPQKTAASRLIEDQDRAFAAAAAMDAAAAPGGGAAAAAAAAAAPAENKHRTIDVALRLPSGGAPVRRKFVASMTGAQLSETVARLFRDELNPPSRRTGGYDDDSDEDMADAADAAKTVQLLVPTASGRAAIDPAGTIAGLHGSTVDVRVVAAPEPPPPPPPQTTADDDARYRADLEAAEIEVVEAVPELWKCMDQRLVKEITGGGGGGGGPQSCLKRLVRELRALPTDLPVHADSSIFLKHDEAYPQLIVALITGPVSCAPCVSLSPWRRGVFAPSTTR